MELHLSADRLVKYKINSQLWMIFLKFKIEKLINFLVQFVVELYLSANVFVVQLKF